MAVELEELVLEVRVVAVPPLEPPEEVRFPAPPLLPLLPPEPPKTPVLPLLEPPVLPKDD